MKRFRMMMGARCSKVMKGPLRGGISISPLTPEWVRPPVPDLGVKPCL